MTKTYYLKKECKCTCHKGVYLPNHEYNGAVLCCDGMPITKGAEVTEWVVRVLNEIDENIKECQNYRENKENDRDMRVNASIEEMIWKKAKQFILKGLIVE